MKFVEEYRNAELVRRLAARIRKSAQALKESVRFMEVCGGHTMAIHRFGIASLLPPQVKLLSGPGCPVCVTPTPYIDRAIALAEEPGAILATFGDLYRVMGAEESLEDCSTRGLDVRVVYSPRDALTIALENPERQVVFAAIGFETTAPTTAATVMEAKSRGVGNFRLLCGHKTMPRALRALMAAPEVRIDGFLLPGHVSTIIGPHPYEFLPVEFGAACCITGFEPTDILQAILMLTGQVLRGEPTVEIQYRRAVAEDGNPAARAVIAEVLEPCDAQWRGLGLIEGSGLGMKDEWQQFASAPPHPSVPSKENELCRCDRVLRGLESPTDCPLFGAACTPDSAVGPCMVSSEGACAAHYKYRTQ